VAWVAGLGSVPAWEAWKAAARFLGLEIGIPLGLAGCFVVAVVAVAAEMLAPSRGEGLVGYGHTVAMAPGSGDGLGLGNGVPLGPASGDLVLGDGIPLGPASGDLGLGDGIPLVPASGDLGLEDGIPLVPGSGKLAWVAMRASPVCRIAHVEALGGRSARSVCPGFELLVAPGSSCLDSDGSDLVKAAISVMGGAGEASLANRCGLPVGLERRVARPAVRLALAPRPLYPWPEIVLPALDASAIVQVVVVRARDCRLGRATTDPPAPWLPSTVCPS